LPASATWVRDGILEKYQKAESGKQKIEVKKNVNGAKPTSKSKKEAVKKKSTAKKK